MFFDQRRQDRLILRAATIDDLLSDGFEPWTGQNDDTESAARRLAAWSRACAAGDQALFEQRLHRDRWSLAQVRERVGAVRRSASTTAPAWLGDAIWIEAALQSPAEVLKPNKPAAGHEAKVSSKSTCTESPRSESPWTESPSAESSAFEQFFTPVIEQADALVWSGLDSKTSAHLTDKARACLRLLLLKSLSGLCAAAIYERFSKARSAGYDSFVAAMKASGFRSLFEDKPVLLRLMACLTRQWIDTSREFILRLAADLLAMRSDILQTPAAGRVAKIEGSLSDPHNGGRSVLILSFEDGARIAYKPKDLRIDVAWHGLITRLNGADSPVTLKAVRAIARDGYGWTEFIDHTGCADAAGCELFFRRAGAWLALLHCFAATDMHQENMIAAGDHPVPIDLETILQPSAEEHKALDTEGQAFDAAMDIIGNSVMTVGLLPAYGRSIDNNVFAMGGMTAHWNRRTVIKWNDINSDAMRPAKTKEQSTITPNLPHVGGRYAEFADHIEDFVVGFADYATFLMHRTRAATPTDLFADFAGLPVRKVIRPTRFYYMLLQRLKDHRTMDDGAVWSAQADFVARLSEWDKENDPLWALQRAERAALLQLNVPHFVSPSNGDVIGDANGISVRTTATSGFDRAVARVQKLDEQEIAWQVEVIRENVKSPYSKSPYAEPPSTKSPLPTAKRAAASEAEPPRDAATAAPSAEMLSAEVDRIAAELSRLAIRRGPAAAWIGLDWLGDAEVFQLVCLGPDLYNGSTGIALFLAAHAAMTASKPSAELALAGLALTRKNLKSRNAARIARSLGIGGATGLGSIVYALAVMAKCLHDDGLLVDAHHAAQLFTDELIAADRQLDVMGGSAGAILALLRLYRDDRSDDVLARAIRCGEHLMRQKRLGADGRRSWVGQGFGARGLNGMSHGAAGFGYALAALAAASGRDEFAEAAAECIAFENASYDTERHNWPDLRGGGQPQWTCQWCHGAPGIGLARAATNKRGGLDATLLDLDIRNALEGVERGSLPPLDTLCCGTLGRVEFFCEAGMALHRPDLRELAGRQLKAVLERAAAAGDYRWNSGKRQFNLGLFRGLAGVGYTLLRQNSLQQASLEQASLQQADAVLPNVIIWE